MILGRAYEGMCQMELAKNAYRQALLIDQDNFAAKECLSNCFHVIY